jgi:hypothetical protein
MQDIKSKYCCPHCGGLPSPTAYAHARLAYKMDGEHILIPTQKMRLLQCCEGEFLATYHKDGKEYFAAIHDHLAFFAPITPWIQKSMRDGKFNPPTEYP